MKSTVLLVPGVVTVTGFDVTGFPFPNRPIWLNGEGLQPGGWQIAVIEAAPGNSGVIDPPPGIVVGVVDTYCRLSPVSGDPFVSTAVTASGWVKLWFTVTLCVPPGGTLNEIEAGGHVEKNPAELPAFATLALIVVEPGCSAVATPFWSIDTTVEVCAW